MCFHICKVVAHPVGGIIPTRRVWRVLVWLTERDHHTGTRYTGDNKRPLQNVKICQTCCGLAVTPNCWKRRRKRLMVGKCALHHTATALMDTIPTDTTSTPAWRTYQLLVPYKEREFLKSAETLLSWPQLNIHIWFPFTQETVSQNVIKGKDVRWI